MTNLHLHDFGISLQIHSRLHDQLPPLIMPFGWLPDDFEICCTGEAMSTISHLVDATHGKGAHGYFDWAPCDPADGLSHYLLVGNRLVSCRSDELSPNIGRPGRGLPAPPHAKLPLSLQWHAWCWDEQQQLHLVYACEVSRSSEVCICTSSACGAHELIQCLLSFDSLCRPHPEHLTVPPHDFHLPFCN